MGVCDKEGLGKFFVFFFTLVFAVGVAVSTTSPNWIAFSATDETDASYSHYVEWGPFYGQSRMCTQGPNSQPGLWCNEWEQHSFDLSDCESASNGTDDIKKLCGHLNTWRITGILCLLLVLVGGGLVLAASCCQMVTCGCCGNSLTCISNVLFSVEVLISIITWSFAISSLNLVKTGPRVTSTEYQWCFWLFLITGTIVGALAAWMADWAAEDSFLRGIWHCVTCRSCRNGDDGDNDKRQPLVGDS